MSFYLRPQASAQLFKMVLRVAIAFTIAVGCLEPSAIAYNPDTENKPELLKPLPTDLVNRAIALGIRAAEWQNAIKAKLGNNKILLDRNLRTLFPEDETVELTPTSPRRISRTDVQQKMIRLEGSFPPIFRQVLIDQSLGYDTELNISNSEFKFFNGMISIIYGQALRLKQEELYLQHYREASYLDHRGYLFLSGHSDRDKKLNALAELDGAKLQSFKNDLLQMCRNQLKGDSLKCKHEIDLAVANSNAAELYKNWLALSKKALDSRFNIIRTRPEFGWQDQTKKILIVQLRTTGRSEFDEHIKSTLESIWRTGDSGLKVVFTHDAPVHFKFETGIVPYASGVGGDTIGLDLVLLSNGQYVNEVFSHEFGHILGFPDCYAELYDEESNAFITYGLDLTNLMCDLRGRAQPQHFEKLKESYPMRDFGAPTLAPKDEIRL